MAPQLPSSPSRRLYLRVAVKLLGAVALLAFAYVLVSAALDPGGPDRSESVSVDLAGLAPGQVRQVSWQGRLVLVLHRSPAMLDTLRRSEPALADPDSSRSQQPPALDNPLRSLRPEYLVVLGHGTDLGCPVEWAGVDAAGAPESWHGGFRDSCRGSWYDLAGRVYADQPATRNLPVPDHHFSGRTLLHLDSR